jgi:polyhydroxyalkanoate synthesis repressor PhaR
MKKGAPQPLIIKKYENRRLYNSATSQYINQDQVAQLVREGHDVRVVDAASGEDLTRLILAQIVVDNAKAPDSILPLDVLRQMILASGVATQENALRYMNAMMEMYQNAYRAMPQPMNPFEFLQGRGGQPGFAGLAPQNTVSSQDGSSASSISETKASEVDELKRRVEELESLLTKRATKADQTPRKNAAKRKSRRKA